MMLTMRLQLMKMKARAVMHELFNDETGAAEVIAMVIILGVVVLLGFLFWDNITELFGNLWESLVGDPAGERTGGGAA